MGLKYWAKSLNGLVLGQIRGLCIHQKKIVKLYHNLVKLKGKDIDTNFTYGNNYIDITYLNVPDFFEMTK